MMPSLRRMAPALAMAAFTTMATIVSSPGHSGASVTKSTVSWAEPPASVPNYIFPFFSDADASNLNVYDFEELLFRPLYYFGGTSDSDALNLTLSLAQAPVYSNDDKTVTIDMKTYRWSNGTKVDARDALFWFNILHAEKTNYALYVPDGIAIPTSISSVSSSSPTQLTITLTRSVNPEWFTDDELWQVVPLPLAWTKTSTTSAAGVAGCATAPYATADAPCKAVYTYLSEQSGYDPTKPTATNDALSTYATNPLWQIVDGPFHLSAFNATGDVTMEPNPDYSGPNKPTVKQFEEKPYTTGAAEYDALVTGQVDVGYLPAEEVTRSTKTPNEVGENNPRLAPTFDASPLNGFRINYIPYNFKSTGDHGEAGKIFSQLYFRQAVQHLVDQPLYISRIFKGYGVPDYGPIPLEPRTPYVSSFEKANPYPYDRASAMDLLSSHGWKVVPNGVDTCDRPGTGAHDCGNGIRKGTRLSLSLLYSSGTTELKDLLDAEKSSWASAGIDVSLFSQSTDTVLGDVVPCAKGCSWELASTGGGWTDTVYPTEPVLFSTGAAANAGSFSTRKADALINATQLTNTALTGYENDLAKELPVLWQPNPADSITEIHKGLHGVTPQSAFQAITPADWHWST